MRDTCRECQSDDIDMEEFEGVCWSLCLDCGEEWDEEAVVAFPKLRLIQGG